MSLKTRTLEPHEMKLRNFIISSTTGMSSYAHQCSCSLLCFSTGIALKQKIIRRVFPTNRALMGLVLLLCWTSLCCSSLVAASPVEEDPQNFNTGATGSFSLNSPRNNDGHRQRGNGKNNQPPISPGNSRQGIKVIYYV